jgi:hypothetical protein
MSDVISKAVGTSQLVITAANAFALHLETACEDFEILQDLIRGDLCVTSRWDNAAGGFVSAEERMKQLRSGRASPRIQMALAKSFLFNARRANRICNKNKAALEIERKERKSFIKEIDKLTPIRDVNEHGFDGDGTAPSMHEHDGGMLDETSLVTDGPGKILMGPVNLCDYYPIVDRMRKIAGFGALFEKRKAAAKLKADFLNGSNWRLVPVPNKSGSEELFDIYIDDHWCGSRRTIKQCHEALRNAGVTLNAGAPH